MATISIIGIQGLPASYGGFETFADNLVSRDKQNQYIIFCSRKDMPQYLKTYNGCELRYLSNSSHGFDSILYDCKATFRSLRRYDIAYILGISGCMFMPLYRLFAGKTKLVVNIDGLEHQRTKWKNVFIRNFLKWSERMAVRFAHHIIADNTGIADYVERKYGKHCTMIPYGGDNISELPPESVQQEILAQYKLRPKQYAISLCRMEPENNIELILCTFAAMRKEKLVMIGNWNATPHSEKLRNAMNKRYKNLILFDPIYDPEITYTLRRNANLYVHGHSAGGTNPSLVEAMFCQVPIAAYDVDYNHYTTHNHAYFFHDEQSLKTCIYNNNNNNNPAPLYECARKYYTWENIIQQYQQFFAQIK